MTSKQSILAGRAIPLTKRLLIYLPFLFSLFWINPISAQENYFKNILIGPSTCDEDNGSIKIETPPTYIDYIWSDSIESLNRDHLAPGVYTIFGEDEDGCIETIVLEVPDISDCELELITWPVPQPIPGSGTIYPCIMVGFSFTLDGVEVAHEYLDILWTITVNGSTFTSTDPTVPVYVNGTVVDLDIALITENGPIPCCTFNDKIQVHDVCPPITPTKVYVSKSTFRDNTTSSAIPGMVELFVYGDGTCEATTDLRGYIIDDNNGQLIPGQDSTLTNGDSLNVDSGFIKFTNDQNWTAVPNGSIITIFESGHTLNSALSSTQDPTDSNQDFHYLLALENPTYFEGSTSQWDFNTQQNTYQGTSLSPSWGLIEANGVTDGMQVRYPNGDYCHGFSYGKNNSTLEENLFVLYLSETPRDYCQIRMDELSTFDKSAFSIQDITGGFTPGQVSPGMQTIVEHLRDCNQPGPAMMVSGSTQIIQNLSTAPKNNSIALVEENTLEVFPNPFRQFLQINYQSSTLGEGSIRIYDSQGRQINHYKIDCNKALQHLEVDFANKSSGLYFVQFQSPEGVIILEKAILIKE